MLRQQSLSVLFFPGNAYLIYSLFFVIPAVMGLGYAFTDWNRYSTDVNYVGTENFRTVTFLWRQLYPIMLATRFSSPSTPSS